MKYLTFLLMMITVNFSTAQSCKDVGTTAEEYNYVVKGYQVQQESGLDMKKGYEIREVRAVSANGRRVVFNELIKDGKDLRAIMAIFTGRDGRTSYFCIPAGTCSKEIRDAYSASVFENIDNAEALNFYQYGLTYLLNNYLTK